MTSMTDHPAAKPALPPLPWRGGCQCGAVRYELSGLPQVFYLCHCTECQKQSASAFGESLRVARADLAIEGRMLTYTRMVDSGARRDCDFCPDCGTRILHRSDANEDHVNLRAGTLDDASFLVPAGHIWTKSRQAFMAIPEDALAFPGQPPSYEPLIARWREMTKS